MGSLSFSFFFFFFQAEDGIRDLTVTGVQTCALPITLNTAATFTPGNNNFIQIRTEVMKVTAGSGSTALTVVRAQNGSAAISTIAVSDTVTPGNPPGQSGITGGNMFVHSDFSVINLNTSDSIALTH